jgi:hypothetical protein
MDPTVGHLLEKIQQIGSRVTAETGTGLKERQRELLQVAQKLCIALQDPGQLVEEFLFGVRKQPSLLHWLLI